MDSDRSQERTGTSPELNLDILTRDKDMATVDRQIDDISAMTKGKKESSTVHFIEAALLSLLTHRLTLCSGSAEAAQGGLRACSELLSELKAVRSEHQNGKGKPSMC